MLITEIQSQVLPSPEFLVNGERWTANAPGGVIAVPENIRRILANTTREGDIEGANTSNSFGLTTEEILSISNDIEENLPILGSNPAIIKLFASLGFRDVSVNEKNAVLSIGANEYEVFKTKAKKGPNKGKEVSVIRMPNYILEGEDTDMANKAINAIKSLFPDRTIQFTLEALNKSADTHGIYPGYRRRDDGRSDNVSRTVYGWAGGDGGAVNAQYVGRDHNGLSGSNDGNRQNVLCLVASFG